MLEEGVEGVFLIHLFISVFACFVSWYCFCVSYC